jgi:hypothetical protein
MNQSRNDARNDATAVVARAYEPTRIENELLAQTFDLVCKGVVSSQEALGASSTTTPRAPYTTSDLLAQTGVGGRRAA